MTTYKPWRVRRLLLLWLTLTAASANARVEILDPRISAQPNSSCETARHVSYGGNDSLLQAKTITSADGTLLLQTDDPILDVVWHDDHGYILTNRELLIATADAQGVVKVSLPAQASGGRLLATSPTFVSFAVSNGHAGAVLGLSSQSLRVVAVEMHYSAAAIDLAGNILIAAERDLYAISRAGRRVPLLRLPQSQIRSIEVMSDNSLLIGTNTGLLKLATNQRAYALFRGAGDLRRLAGDWLWCDSSSNRSYRIQGLELPGTRASDEREARDLLSEIDDQVRSHHYPEAYSNALLLQQIAPGNEAVKALVTKLRRQQTRQKAPVTNSAAPG